jgi:hypothetical protein
VHWWAAVRVRHGFDERARLRVRWRRAERVRVSINDRQPRDLRMGRTCGFVWIAVDEVETLPDDVGAELRDKILGPRFLDEADVERRGGAVGNDRPHTGSHMRARKAADVEGWILQRILQPRESPFRRCHAERSIRALSSGTSSSIARSSGEGGTTPS